FFWLADFNLPRSRIFTTGGTALGDISTRSSPASSASSNASLMETSPRFLLSASRSWTRGTRISRLERGPSLVGAAALKGLRMVVVSLSRFVQGSSVQIGERANVVSARAESIAQR